MQALSSQELVAVTVGGAPDPVVTADSLTLSLSSGCYRQSWRPRERRK